MDLVFPGCGVDNLFLALHLNTWLFVGLNCFVVGSETSFISNEGLQSL